MINTTPFTKIPTQSHWHAKIAHVPSIQTPALKGPHYQLHSAQNSHNSMSKRKKETLQKSAVHWGIAEPTNRKLTHSSPALQEMCNQTHVPAQATTSVKLNRAWCWAQARVEDRQARDRDEDRTLWTLAMHTIQTSQKLHVFSYLGILPARQMDNPLFQRCSKTMHVTSRLISYAGYVQSILFSTDLLQNTRTANHFWYIAL